MNQQISDYQKARKLIERHSVITPFWSNIKHLKLNKNQLKGIQREWRAYWYLASRFKKTNFSISSAADDARGIDIIGIKDDGKKQTFQIGGNTIKRNKCDYYVQVTDFKIYVRKGVQNDR